MNSPARDLQEKVIEKVINIMKLLTSYEFWIFRFFNFFF